MTYPDDIMKAAEQVAAYHPYTKHEIPELANNIARAIMTERHRCEDIANHELTNSATGGAAETAARNIASKIRSGGHA